MLAEASQSCLVKFLLPIKSSAIMTSASFTPLQVAISKWYSALISKTPKSIHLITMPGQPCCLLSQRDILISSSTFALMEQTSSTGTLGVTMPIKRH
jgi:hypothetical protein